MVSAAKTAGRFIRWHLRSGTTLASRNCAAALQQAKSVSRFTCASSTTTGKACVPIGRSAGARKAEIAGGGLLYDVGSHLFDIASHTLGPVESATGFLHHIPRERIDKQSGKPAQVETDDLANCWFRFANGVRGQWFVSRVTPPFAEIGYVEVIGTEGALESRFEPRQD